MHTQEATLEVQEDDGTWRAAILYRHRLRSASVVVFFGGGEYEGLDGNYQFGEDNILRDGDGDTIRTRSLKATDSIIAPPTKRGRGESRSTRVRCKVPKVDGRERVATRTTEALPHLAKASFEQATGMPPKPAGAATNSAHTTGATPAHTTANIVVKSSSCPRKPLPAQATPPCVISTKSKKPSPTTVLNLTAALTANAAPVIKSYKTCQPVPARKQTSLLSLWGKKP